MWKFFQADKKGTPAIFEKGMQVVTLFTCPPLLPQKNIIFCQKITDDGLSTGSDDMGVDGSSTSVPFWIPAHKDKDRYLTNISIVIGYGTAADLFEFADKGAALTNGVRITYEHAEKGIIEIANPKINYSLLRLALAPIASTAWEMRHFAANNDYGMIINLPLSQYLPPYGVKLDRGTLQRFQITIRDNCSDADVFNMTALGFDRFE